MAAGTFQFYDATAKFLLGGADFTTATVKVAIVEPDPKLKWGMTAFVDIK